MIKMKLLGMMVKPKNNYRKRYKNSTSKIPVFKNNSKTKPNPMKKAQEIWNKNSRTKLNNLKYKF